MVPAASILRLATCLLVLFVSTHAQNGHFKRLCYVSSWARYRDHSVAFNPEDIGANLCTHLSFAFATLDHTATRLTADDPSDDPDLYQRFNAIKKHHPHIKTLLSVGGWSMGSTLFTRLVANHSNIHAFSVNAVTYLRAKGFDGLDVDWEYPADRGSPPNDKHHFTQLIRNLHHQFTHETLHSGQKRLILSAALSPSPDIVQNSYEAVALGKALDIINLMTYNLHGEWEHPLVTAHHAALYGTATDPNNNVDAVAKYWANMGIPKHKILIGLPFYGKSFTLTDKSSYALGANASGPGAGGHFTREAGELAYFEICKLIQSGATTHVITNQSVPYLVDHNRWVGYDDEKSLQEKVKYVVKNGYGGIMVWALDEDDFGGICGKKYPLMNAVKNAFHALIGK